MNIVSVIGISQYWPKISVIGISVNFHIGASLISMAGVSFGGRVGWEAKGKPAKILFIIVTFYIKGWERLKISSYYVFEVV